MLDHLASHDLEEKIDQKALDIVAREVRHVHVQSGNHRSQQDMNGSQNGEKANMSIDGFHLAMSSGPIQVADIGEGDARPHGSGRKAGRRQSYYLNGTQLIKNSYRFQQRVQECASNILKEYHTNTGKREESGRYTQSATLGDII
jgi:hypothetical protein